MFANAQSFKEISRNLFVGNGLLAYGKHPAGEKKKRGRKMLGLRNKKIKSSPIFCLSARVTVRGTYFISGTANRTYKFRAVLKVYSSLNFPFYLFLTLKEILNNKSLNM